MATSGTTIEQLAEFGHHLRKQLKRIRDEEVGGKLPHKASVSQADALHAIDKYGDLGITRAAEYLGMTQPGLSIAIGALVEKGFLATGEPGKSRMKTLRITRKGRDVVEARVQGELAVARRLLSFCRPDEKKMFVDVLARIAIGTNG